MSLAGLSDAWLEHLGVDGSIPHDNGGTETCGGMIREAQKPGL